VRKPARSSWYIHARSVSRSTRTGALGSRPSLIAGNSPGGDLALDRPTVNAELLGDLGKRQEAVRCGVFGHAATVPTGREDAQAVLARLVLFAAQPHERGNRV
jgi:hypothetical protein